MSPETNPKGLDPLVKAIVEHFQSESNFPNHKLFFLTSTWNISESDSAYGTKSSHYLSKLFYFFRDHLTHSKNYNRAKWQGLCPTLYGWLEKSGKGRDTIKENHWHHHGILAVHNDTMPKLMPLYLKSDDPAKVDYYIGLPERYYPKEPDSENRKNFVRNIQLKPIRDTDHLVNCIAYATEFYRFYQKAGRANDMGFSVFGPPSKNSKT